VPQNPEPKALHRRWLVLARPRVLRAKLTAAATSLQPYPSSLDRRHGRLCDRLARTGTTSSPRLDLPRYELLHGRMPLRWPLRSLCRCVRPLPAARFKQGKRLVALGLRAQAEGARENTDESPSHRLSERMDGEESIAQPALPTVRQSHHSIRNRHRSFRTYQSRAGTREAWTAVAREDLAVRRRNRGRPRQRLRLAAPSAGRPPQR